FRSGLCQLGVKSALASRDAAAAHVRFAPIATELLHYREWTRCTKGGIASTLALDQGRASLLRACLALHTSDLLLEPCQVFFPSRVTWRDGHERSHYVSPLRQLLQGIRNPVLSFIDQTQVGVAFGEIALPPRVAAVGGSQPFADGKAVAVGLE